MSRRITSLFFLVLLMRVMGTTVVVASEYHFAWPGILPDHPLYKIKVARNKLIEKMIYSPVKRIEFDLLMADKTLYASKLLMEKGENALARETALKGENYFSILISDYRRAREENFLIPTVLDKKIAEAYKAHQELIAYLIEHATETDKETYKQVDYFSKNNYQSLRTIQQNQE